MQAGDKGRAMPEHYYNRASFRFNAARTVSSPKTDNSAANLYGNSFICCVDSNPTDDKSAVIATPEDQPAILALAESLDYSDLNTVLSEPTDIRIANHIHNSLDIGAIENIHLKSEPDKGVHIRSGNTNIWRSFRLESAHQLPHVAPEHKCSRMHGHGFTVALHHTLSNSDLNDSFNYSTIEKLWQPIDKQLNYACLNEFKGLENPTSENLCTWILEKVKAENNSLSAVTVLETPTSGCQYDGDKHTTWKDFTIDCALESDNSWASVYGHTYLIRIYVQSDLDPVYGWTVDFGDIKALFDEQAASLDHYNISREHDIKNSADLASHLFSALQTSLPKLARIDVLHKPGQGVITFSPTARAPQLQEI